MHTLMYFIFLFGVFGECFGTIYQLNETEYNRFPILFELDDYHECLEDGDTYCIATLELHGDPENILYNDIQEYSKHTVKHFNYKIIDRGVCVEKKCQNYMKTAGLSPLTDINVVLEGYFNVTIGEKYNLSTRISSLDCDTRNDEKDPINNVDWIFATIVAIIVISTLIGSYYDVNRKNKSDENLGTGQRSLLCFSVFRNMDKLTQVNPTQLVELKGLSAIRVITETLVVYGHVIYLFSPFSTNPHTFEKSYDTPMQRLVFSSSSVVQLFFFISAFLLTYTLQVAEEKHYLSWKKIPQYIFARWWRLAPPIAFVLAFVSTWFRFLGSGPLWKRHIMNGVTSQCSTYYWTHIFFFNNYMRDEYLCSPESWHVAADTQLFVVGLLVHFLIRKRSWKVKLGTLSVLLLIGMVSPIAHVILQDLDGFFIMTPEGYRTLRDETFRTYHILAPNNIACYIMGMANGYLVYYLKQKKIEFPNFKLGKFLSWFSIPFLAGVFYVASAHLEDGERPSVTWRALYAANHRVVIGLIATLHTVGVIMKYNHFSTNVLERNGWQVLGKLSYCVYLIHDHILLYLMGSRTQLITFSFPNLILMFLKVITLSQAFALVLHLLVEAPACQLLKIFMGDRSSKKKED